MCICDVRVVALHLSDYNQGRTNLICDSGQWLPLETGYKPFAELLFSKLRRALLLCEILQTFGALPSGQRPVDTRIVTDIIERAEQEVLEFGYIPNSMAAFVHIRCKEAY
jgi:hypothetical protein